MGREDAHGGALEVAVDDALRMQVLEALHDSAEVLARDVNCQRMRVESLAHDRAAIAELLHPRKRGRRVPSACQRARCTCTK